jgi:hypothetical protein
MKRRQNAFERWQRIGIKKNRKRKGNIERKGNEEEERSRVLRYRKSAMKGLNSRKHGREKSGERRIIGIGTRKRESKAGL